MGCVVVGVVFVWRCDVVVCVCVGVCVVVLLFPSLILFDCCCYSLEGHVCVDVCVCYWLLLLCFVLCVAFACVVCCCLFVCDVLCLFGLLRLMRFWCCLLCVS